MGVENHMQRREKWSLTIVMFIIMNGMATTYTRTSQPVTGPRPVGKCSPAHRADGLLDLGKPERVDL